MTFPQKSIILHLPRGVLYIDPHNETPTLPNMFPPFETHPYTNAHARIAIFVFREDGEIVHTNSEASRLYGFSPEEFLGRRIDSFLLDPHEAAKLFSTMARSGEGRESPPTPYRRLHTRKDGSKLAVTVVLGSFQVGEEKLFIKYVIDASSVEQTELKLEESQHRFKAVADYTYDWESWLDSNGSLIWVNPAIERIAGYSVHECMLMHDYPLPIVLPDDREKVQRLIEEALGGSSGNDIEFRIQDKTMHTKWIAVSWQPLLSDKELPVGVRMSMRDIDDRKAMEQQLRDYATRLEKLADERAKQIVLLESERAKIERLAALGKLAANVAHEINNPLAGIKNAFQILKNESGKSEDELLLIQLIDKEIDRMTKVLRQMTQLYRPGITPPSTFDLLEITHQLATLMSGEASSRGVRIDVQSSLNSSVVRVPEIEFRQILHNLLLNAIEASNPGDRVLVSIGNPDRDKYCITVRDHGLGIDPSIHSKIFEPFFSTKNSPNRPGSGLGLAISKSLASAIGVELEFIPHEKPGAAFRVTIPQPSHLP